MIVLTIQTSANWHVWSAHALLQCSNSSAEKQIAREYLNLSKIILKAERKKTSYTGKKIKRGAAKQTSLKFDGNNIKLSFSIRRCLQTCHLSA